VRFPFVLQADAARYTWVAAAVGSNAAAGYQLPTGDPMMPVCGFNGTDPSPTLEQSSEVGLRALGDPEGDSIDQPGASTRNVVAVVRP
jgi:hypothetical protein